MLPPLERLATAVTELVEPRSNTERFTRETGHGLVTHFWTMRIGSLLDQLGYAVTPGSHTEEGGMHPIPGSRPTASIEALDALMAIEVESTRIVIYLGGTDRHELTANLRGLVGAASAHDEDAQTYTAGIAERWVSRAKVLTGWDRQPWRPENTCPMCDQMRSLRVRVVTGTEVHACCVACGETWTPETIGLLGEHCRWENGEIGETA